MTHFPLFLKMDGFVLLVGEGPESDYKLDRLKLFGAEVRRLKTLTEADLEPRPLMVVAGDLSMEENEYISTVCMERHIPVNIVDVPQLCSFYFPAIIRNGALTVAISTDGKSPAAAVLMKQRMAQLVPDHSGEIVDWLASLRGRYNGKILKAAAVRAFDLDRPLTEGELNELL